MAKSEQRKPAAAYVKNAHLTPLLLSRDCRGEGDAVKGGSMPTICMRGWVSSHMVQQVQH